MNETADRPEIRVDRRADRDRHLFGKGPKKLLALDGGGVRGAITVAFLERIEKIIAEEQHKLRAEEADEQTRSQSDHGQDVKPICLGDWFDLVGGTSTGAIIAGALALGHSTAEIKDFYLRLAPRAFRRPFWRLPYLQAKFDADALSHEVNQIVGDRTLDAPDLRTGLAIITKRMDTGSPWILANNKNSKFWNDPSDHSYIGNKHYKLAALVRASTAAPHYFDPEVISILDAAPPGPLSSASAQLGGLPWLKFLLTRLRAQYAVLFKTPPDPKTHGLFVDGGVTPFNSPPLVLLMMAVLEPFGIRWSLGPENLTIVSIGTGTFRTKVTFSELGFAGPLRLALGALLSVMADNQYLALAQMQWLGKCLTSWTINSEVGTLSLETPPGGHWFRFARYDLGLDTDWLSQNLGLDLTDNEVKRLRRMDDPGIIKCIYGIARLAAEKQVKKEHLFPDNEQLTASAASEERSNGSTREMLR